MTVRHMKIFIEVYQTGNITRAAENLYITRPVVSRSIQELERYYGVRLFERINQRISVTEAGKQFLVLIPSFLSISNIFRFAETMG